MEDMPATTHLHLRFFPFPHGHELWKGEQNNWGNQNYDTYVKLQPGTDARKCGEIEDAVERTAITPVGPRRVMKDVEKAVKSIVLPCSL